ncbi:MAG: GH25 family lysozyme, partial [Gemmatimonadetes bacterium]|nr:GH25 family lysozyme [Gemmatimonadota bacterium]
MAFAIASCDDLVSPDGTGPRREALTVSGDSPVFAVDVSFWAGFLAESEVACWYDSGVRHAIIGTQSSSFTQQQLGLAVDAGLSVDAYVYLYWNVDMTAQVRTALNTIASYPVQRLWLDAEAPPNGRTASQLVDKLQEAVGACGDQPCGIYTRKVWWRDNMADSRAFAHLPIWYAYYNGQDNFDDWYNPTYWYEGPFGGWADPTGKQYDSDWTAPDLCGVNVDYNAMYTLAPPAGPPFQAEIGKITVDQASKDGWHAVSLDNTFASPVVIMQPPSYAGAQQSTVRIRNVTPSSFEFQIDEWDYLDGAHVAETMGYLVVEAGVHQLEGGALLQAGTVSADHQFTSVTFREAFGSAPVILSQVQTRNESSAVVTRQRNASASTFEVRLQEEEGSDGVHAPETVGYIAVTLGTDVMEGSAFEAALTPDMVGSEWHTLSFAQSYSDAVLLAGIQTFDGSDPAALRYKNLTSTGAEIKVEEEASG